MRVQGKQFKLLNDALLDAYNKARLEQMLQFALGERLDVIVSGGDFSSVIFDLISEFNRRDQVQLLIQAARQHNPNDGGLVQAAEALGFGVIATHHTPEGVQPIQGGLEKLVKKHIPQLDAVKMREMMTHIEGQMCLVEKKVGNHGIGCGSGFLIGPNTVLTNYHVVKDFLGGNKAQNLQVRFDTTLYDENVKPADEGAIFDVAEIALSAPFTKGDATNSSTPPSATELDFAILVLDADAAETPVGGYLIGQKSGPRGWVKMPTIDPVLNPNDPLIIYHFPGAGHLRMAIDTEAVVGLQYDGLRLRYRNNTAKGSSGSPVFDFDWNLVALHHAGELGKEPVTYNQGIPIDKIIAYVKAQGKGDLFGDS